MWNYIPTVQFKQCKVFKYSFLFGLIPLRLLNDFSGFCRFSFLFWFHFVMHISCILFIVLVCLVASAHALAHRTTVAECSCRCGLDAPWPITSICPPVNLYQLYYHHHHPRTNYQSIVWHTCLFLCITDFYHLNLKLSKLWSILSLLFQTRMMFVLLWDTKEDILK